MTQVILKLNKGSIFGVRHVQVFLLFICCTLSYFIRINVSVAVVAMTNSNTTNPDFEEFPWKEQEKNVILSSFFWGYVATQLPGGWLAQRYGAKFLLLSSVLIPSLLSLITPISIKYGGWQAFCGIRIVQGFFQGIIFPSFHTFLAKWAPIKERNRLGAFTHSGVEFGTILAFSASGFIAASPLGWPGISYITGGLGLIWSAIWLYFGSNTPAESKSISIAERKYIEASLESNGKSDKRLKTPWLKIWTSIPFWSLLVARTGQSWGFIILLTQIPTYMNSILKMDIKSNAIFSAIPYVVMLLVSYSFIYVSDVLSSKKVRLPLIRKTMNSIAFWIPAITISGLGFVGTENIALAVVLLTFTVGCNGAHTLGSVLNHIDLAPNHAGVLMGITNTVGNTISIIAPLVNAQIVNNEKDQSQWRTMFFITAGFFFIGNLIYITFGKADPQPWNTPEITKNEDIEEDKK